MNLIEAASNALAELREYHADHGTCPEPNLCPTAVAIRDLELAIAEETLSNPPAFMPGEIRVERKEHGAEATYPAMTVEDVAAAVIEAQSGIGK